MNVFEIIAEQKIQEAIKNGVFDNLPGKGKPINIENLSDVSPEDRMAYKILKNAGVLPPEMQVRKEIKILEEKMLECNSDDEKSNIRNKLNKIRTAYNIMMEKNKRKY